MSWREKTIRNCLTVICNQHRHHFAATDPVAKVTCRHWVVRANPLVARPGHAICGEGSSDDLPRRGFTIVPSYHKLLKTLVRPLVKYVETRPGWSDDGLSKALSY